MAKITKQLAAYLPAALKNLLAGNPRRELLKNVDVCLLVHDDMVLCLETGNAIKFQDESSELDLELLARCSKSLFEDGQKEHSILLLLPANEFVATNLSLPGVGEDNLLSALQLQAEFLLPAFEKNVVPAINTLSASKKNEEHVVLWMTTERIDAFTTAFQKQGLLLAAVKPRALALAEQNGQNSIIDNDRRTVTAIKSVNGVIQSWLHINRIDFDQAELVEQWQLETKSSGDNYRELSEIGDYLNQSDKYSFQEYSFFPQSSLNARKRVETGKKYLVAAGLIAGLLLLASIPFIAQTVEFRGMAAALESSRVLSNDARQDQAIVVNFENNWGPISDFPEQRLREAMYTLQNVLLPDQLTSLELSEGLAKLQGTSAEPQSILQRLEQDPMFTEVIFSRATNNSRYYIDLRLSEVNFEAYMVRYFPDE